MSKTEYNGSDTDNILRILDEVSKVEETIKGTNNAIKSEEQQLERLKPHLGWSGPNGKPLTEEQYRKMMREQVAERIRQKSIGKPKIPTNKATFIDKAMNFLDEYKFAITGALAAAILTVVALGPSIKVSSQKNDLSKNLGEHFVQLKYCEQTDGLFKKFKLTISPRMFVNNLNLTADNDMRLYILSTVLRQEDFDNILWELGFNSQEDYLRRLGFKHGELRASEQYSNEYEEKLKNIIKNLNENPDNANEFFDKYPELRFIVDSNNTIMIDGEIITTRNHGGRK